MANKTNLRTQFQALVHMSDNASTEVKELVQNKSIKFEKAAADAMANTATAEGVVWVAPYAGKVLSVKLVSTTAGPTADDTNSASLILAKRTAGAAAVNLAIYTTNVASATYTAWNSKSFTLQTTTTFAANDALTWTIAKNGSGAVINAAVFVIEYEET